MAAQVDPRPAFWLQSIEPRHGTPCPFCRTGNSRALCRSDDDGGAGTKATTKRPFIQSCFL